MNVFSCQASARYVCIILYFSKAALTEIIRWEFFESLRQKTSLAPNSISEEKTGWYGE